MNIKSSLAVLTSVATLLVSSLSFAGADVEIDENNVILAGHDAVSYFTENKAVEGNPHFTAVHNEAIYYFSSPKNRDVFKANPSKYAPQFGGFCAYGATLGKKFEINGKAFEVVNGKLYVNKNEDVYEVWVEDKAENITIGHKKWTKIENVLAAKL